MRRDNRLTPTSRDGFFLIVVLIVIAVATMAAYSFTDTMLAYDEATHLSSDRVQTQVAADSGVEAARMIVSQSVDIRDSLGGVKNNAILFQAVNVVSPLDGGRACNFSVLAPGMDDTGRLGGIQFGLQNESARLNINALITLENNSAGMMAGVALLAAAANIDSSATDELASDSLATSLLLALPGMTSDVADCILDWLDEDDEPRPYGAEVEYYSTLPTPYQPANGPINSVEELLLVRGVTPSLLFGVDANRNGVVDAAEQQNAAVDINSVASLGMAAYITVHGLESNRRRDGSPRIDINQDDLESMYDEIAAVIENEDYATFLAAYRVYGKSTAASATTGSQSGGGSSGGNSSTGSGGQTTGSTTPTSVPAATGSNSQTATSTSNSNGGTSGGGNTSTLPPKPWEAAVFDDVDLSGGGGTKLTQLLDVVDATVTVGNGNNAQVYTSPFTSDPVQMALYMPLLMENFSTQAFESMPGRININDCPAELLLGIPLLDEETANAIIEARAEPSESENRLYETWPLVEGIVTIEQMRSLMPLITAGGDVFRVQVIGYYEDSAAATRVEAIIDATTLNPQVIQYRDLSHLGRGFDLAVLGIRNTPEQ